MNGNLKRMVAFAGLFVMAFTGAVSSEGSGQAQRDAAGEVVEVSAISGTAADLEIVETLVTVESRKAYSRPMVTIAETEFSVEGKDTDAVGSGADDSTAEDADGATAEGADIADADTADAEAEKADTWDEDLEEYFGYIPTDDELDLFYRTVQAECGDLEPDDGVGAVSDVIANRCKHKSFPDTLTEVITQKNQFETWDKGMIDVAVPSEQVMDVCESRIKEGVVYSDILYFTAGYYNPWCEPAFVIGHHYFGTEKETE